jgi:3-hydroxyacyl-CoA dehydrogenase
MRLLEVVRGTNTNKEVIATTMKLAKSIKKVPVLAGNCDGFIGNRMFHEYVRQAHALAEEGAKVANIDRVIYEFGWAMGPFAVNDLAGNDVGWRIRKRHKQEGKYDNLRYTSTVADQLCELGRYGQKTNRGFYIYDPTTRKKEIDPEVDMMFEKVADKKGISRRSISDEEILNRLSWALLNTGCMILDEGFALRASDIDVTYSYGYGYPLWRGGPMKYAEDYGLDKVLKEIEKFRSLNSDMWPKSSYLEKIIHEGGKFKK